MELVNILFSGLYSGFSWGCMIFGFIFGFVIAVLFYALITVSLALFVDMINKLTGDDKHHP